MPSPRSIASPPLRPMTSAASRRPSPRAASIPRASVAVLRQDRGQRLRQRFLARHCDASLQLLFERHGGTGRRADLPRDVRRHGRRHGAALARARARPEGTPAPDAALAIGSRAYADVLPRAARPPCAGRQVAAGVRSAMREAADCRPRRRALRAGEVSAAHAGPRRRGAGAAAPTTATRDTLKSMGLSRAASALGVAVALGEIDRDAIAEADIGAELVAVVRRAPALRPASS